MFLGVSGSVNLVEMSPLERQMFAEILKTVRNGRFKGNRKAAYTEAGVNSATWARAEAGDTIKEHSLTKIVANLFPRTGGDWTKLRSDRGGMMLDYWDTNGLVPPHENANPVVDMMQGLYTDLVEEGVEDWDTLRKVLAVINARLAGIEKTVARLESDVKPLRKQPSTSQRHLEVAAHEEEHSIEDEQLEPDIP